MKIRLTNMLFILSVIVMMGCSSARNEDAFYEEENFKTEKELSEKIIEANSKENKIRINEQLVEQKIKDLEDYLNLLMDNEIPTEFATNINEQIQNLIYVVDSSDTNYLNLRDWIEQRITERQSVKFSTIKIIEESVHAISRERIFNVSLKTRIKKAKNQKVIFSFLLREVDKEFGTEIMKVNELKLVGLVY